MKEPIRKVRLSGGTIRYRAVVDVGRRPDGRRLQRTETHATLKEARAWVARTRADVSSPRFRRGRGRQAPRPRSHLEGAMSAPSAPASPALAGLLGRCPACGRGRLFKGYIAMPPACEACGLDYGFADSGDGPAVFVMLIAGFLATLPAKQPPFPELRGRMR